MSNKASGWSRWRARQRGSEGGRWSSGVGHGPSTAKYVSVGAVAQFFKEDRVIGTSTVADKPREKIYRVKEPLGSGRGSVQMDAYMAHRDRRQNHAALEQIGARLSGNNGRHGASYLIPNTKEAIAAARAAGAKVPKGITAEAFYRTRFSGKGGMYLP